MLGKSRSHVTNILRLLKLPEEVQEMINQGKISMSHARALINCDGDVVELAKEIIAQNMSVRDIESYVRKNDSIKEKKPSRSIRGKRLNADKEQDLIELEQTISKNLGLEVEIEYDPARGGNILINFANLSQLDKVMKLLSNNII